MITLAHCCCESAALTWYTSSVLNYHRLRKLSREASSAASRRPHRGTNNTMALAGGGFASKHRKWQ